jgi:hypothetical protein
VAAAPRSANMIGVVDSDAIIGGSRSAGKAGVRRKLRTHLVNVGVYVCVRCEL